MYHLGWGTYFRIKILDVKKLLKLYPEYLRTSLYRHAVKSIDSTQVVDQRKFNKGKPKKVSLMEKIIILWEMHNLREEFGSIAIKGLWFVSGLGNKVCDEIYWKRRGTNFFVLEKSNY